MYAFLAPYSSKLRDLIIKNNPSTGKQMKDAGAVKIVGISKYCNTCFAILLVCEGQLSKTKTWFCLQSLFSSFKYWTSAYIKFTVVHVLLLPDKN